MADFYDIVGHEHIIEHFKGAISMQKVSHAYILNGDALSGKKTLSAAFSKALQCEKQDGTACGICQSCLQAESHNHPDIIWVTHSKPNTISVDDIRTQVNGDVAIKPYSGRYKIYIIDDAQKMNEAAQNAILKTIEEPPAYVVIMLLTTNTGRLLQTILSRCVLLNIRAVPDEKIKEYLQKRLGIDEEKADFCVGFAMGNLGKAIHVADSPEFNEIKDDCVHLLKYLDKMEVYELIESLKNLTKYKLKIDDYLDFMMAWYRDVLILKATSDANRIIYKTEYGSLIKAAQKSSYEGIDKILKEIEKAKIRLNANVNFDLAMELLLLTIKEN